MCLALGTSGLWLRCTTPQPLHPSAIQGKEGIKFCHLATLTALWERDWRLCQEIPFFGGISDSRPTLSASRERTRKEMVAVAECKVGRASEQVVVGNFFRLTNDHWDQVGGTAINVRLLSPLPHSGLFLLLLPPPPPLSLFSKWDWVGYSQQILTLGHGLLRLDCLLYCKYRIPRAYTSTSKAM